MPGYVRSQVADTSKSDEHIVTVFLPVSCMGYCLFVNVWDKCEYITASMHIVIQVLTSCNKICHPSQKPR